MGYILPIVPSQFSQYSERGIKIKSKEKYVIASKKIQNNKRNRENTYNEQTTYMKKTVNQFSREEGKGRVIDVYI